MCSAETGTMKVIVFSNTSWNLFNFRLPLMTRLQEEGYEVVAAAPEDKYSERIRRLGFRYLNVPLDNKGTNPVRDLILLLRLFRVFRREKPDMILTYTPKPNIYAAIAAGCLSIHLIPNISGLGNVFIRQGMVTRIVKMLYSVALRFPAIVLFQNYDDLKLFVKLALVDGAKAKRIPGSGINTAYYKPEELCPTHTRGFVFLLVGRMLWDKGVGEYVEAAKILSAKYPDVVFRLLGFLDVENPQAVSKQQMQTWVEEGVVEYVGESDDVKSYMLDADCVVLPSYREGLPRTLLEGASLGRPLICTDVPGCRDVVDAEVTGYLCEVRNAVDLAGKMERMISLSQQQRLNMGKRGREKVIREFDENIVIDQYLREINIVSGHGNCR